MVVVLQGVVLSYEIFLQEEIDKFDEEIVVKVQVSDVGYCYFLVVQGEGSQGVQLVLVEFSYKVMCSYWKVKLCVEIVQYQVFDEKGWLKIVVVLFKILVFIYVVGDNRVVFDEVVCVVCGCLLDIFMQIRCFIVLDCEFGVEL